MEQQEDIATVGIPATRPSAVPPWQRDRALKTTAIYLAFVVSGLVYAILGPSLPSLEILLDTSTKQIAWGFTGNSMGYLCGAVICGFVYERLNKELTFLTSLLISGAATIVIPFSKNLGMFIGSMVMHGFCMGFVDTGSQSYILKLWEKHRHMPAVVQALHGMWSVGSTIGPFILHPFLADIHDEPTNATTEAPAQANQTYFDADVNSSLSTELPNLDTADDDALKEKLSLVRVGFLIISAFIFVTASVFLAAFIKNGPSLLERYRKRLKPKTSVNGDVPTSQMGKRFKMKLLAIAAVFFMFFSWLEGLPGIFLATFVVKGLGWENDQGALITATYWGTHGAGRAIGVGTAFCLKPHQMVIADIVVATLGFVLMFFTSYHFSIIWISTALIGLGIATLFASALLHLEKFIEITGSTASVIVVSTSVGGMVSPLLTGFLMDKYSHMALASVGLWCCITEAVLCIGLLVFTHRHGVKRHRADRDNASDTHEGTIFRSVEMVPLK